MDEFEEIVPGVYGTIYKYIPSQGRAYAEEFAIEVKFPNDHEIMVGIYAKELTCIMDEYLNWFNWIFKS